MSSPTDDAILAVWRNESVRLLAGLARMTHDLDLAEDLAQDALVAALEQWPREGIPRNPGAWLMSIAKRRAIDGFRRDEVLRRKVALLGHELEEGEMPDLAAAVDHIEDDVLRLMFLSCHPALAPDSRTVLTLRLVGGLTTAEIARAYFAKESAVGQRISRAKRTLAEAGASFELPVGAERASRMREVMQTIYLVFNEGYTATAGPSWTRPELCLEGMRLARMLAALAPGDPEAQALQGLLEIQGSRLVARADASGKPVLLEDQDRTRWDQLLLRRGLAAVERATALATSGIPGGSYLVQAMIAACHGRARRAEETDWAEIARLYDLLASGAPGAVIEVNRAVAHGRAFGPEAGLAILAALPDGALAGSHLPSGVRGDLLHRAGRHLEAAAAFAEAASLTTNADERSLLESRATACRNHAVPSDASVSTTSGSGD
ncbi:RNA polymerase ECF family sigma subunit [Nocardioides albertanoniae]|uniref:RNA polymerase sigma factor n=1 Tax=Nocardioides albertanoniae TaxID=1175486 RepID=A0A543AAQ2_9ACTN|nr:RNA polymerase sigma factor [Nocardioides albertanoniae]TQL69677.1 RNA polymerase ECF family sigma subunit [Nocardioides albertanoniae]